MSPSCEQYPGNPERRTTPLRSGSRAFLAQGGNRSIEPIERYSRRGVQRLFDGRGAKLVGVPEAIKVSAESGNLYVLAVGANAFQN
jgi:hypothetical protein